MSVDVGGLLLLLPLFFLLLLLLLLLVRVDECVCTYTYMYIVNCLPVDLVIFSNRRSVEIIAAAV